MAWKSAALQRRAGDSNQLPASSLAGSQATPVRLGHCAVLTSAGDSSQYSKHYWPLSWKNGPLHKTLGVGQVLQASEATPLYLGGDPSSMGAMGTLGHPVHRSPWNWLALGSCMPTKQMGIFKDLAGYSTKLRQLTVDVTVTGHSRCWGCKDGSQIVVKQVNACNMMKQVAKNRNKDSVNPIPTPLKTQPNDDNDSTSKDRQIWGGQKSHLHMIYYKFREVRV